MGKKHFVPEELMDIYDEVETLRSLKKLYVKRPFGYKKALKSGKLEAKKNREFWGKLRDLYPELKGTLQLDFREEGVFVKKAKK